MKIPDDCQEPDYHKMHLCILRHISAEEVERLSSDPAFHCRRCHLEAREAKNLCQPQEL